MRGNRLFGDIFVFAGLLHGYLIIEPLEATHVLHENCIFPGPGQVDTGTLLKLVTGAFTPRSW